MYRKHTPKRPATFGAANRIRGEDVYQDEEIQNNKQTKIILKRANKKARVCEEDNLENAKDKTETIVNTSEFPNDN